MNSHASGSTFDLCPNYATAPYNCGLVQKQMLYDVNGDIVGIYVCGLCDLEARKHLWHINWYKDNTK